MSGNPDIFRSTPKSRPNNMGQMSISPYVRPSTNRFSDSDEIWYVGSSRVGFNVPPGRERSMSDARRRRYAVCPDPIQGQVRNSSISTAILM